MPDTSIPIAIDDCSCAANVQGYGPLCPVHCPPESECECGLDVIGECQCSEYEGDDLPW